jgi:peptide-methionine (S)-S-oxide reductase
MGKATFGAGCFWGVEAAFRRLKGVKDAAVGYAGGTKPEPTYPQVCTGRTGHAEVVQVEYDSDHDPTTPDRQGPDVGTQYRSAVFYHTEEQRALAEASKKKLEASGLYPDPIVTEITPAGQFWRAEEYHQRYLEKRGLNTCG